MKSMVDFWSIIHFGMWAFLSSTISATFEPPLWVHWLYTSVLGYAWEGIEYYLQRKFPAKWSNKTETWQNSWIGDPLSNLLGATFGWFVVAFYRKHYWIWKKIR